MTPHQTRTAREALHSLRAAAAALSALGGRPEYEPLAHDAVDMARRLYEHLADEAAALAQLLAVMLDPLPTGYTPKIAPPAPSACVAEIFAQDVHTREILATETAAILAALAGNGRDAP